MKKIIPLLVVIFLIAGGGLYYFKLRSQNKPELTTSVDNKKKESLFDWFKNDQGVECQITPKEGGNVTVIAKKGKIKVSGQEVSLGAQGKTNKAIFINDGQWIYIWSEEEKNGIKYLVPKEEEKENKDQKTTLFSPEEAIKEWQEGNYHCQPKRVSDQEFIPPQDINFLNLSDFSPSSFPLGK